MCAAVVLIAGGKIVAAGISRLRLRSKRAAFAVGVTDLSPHFGGNSAHLVLVLPLYTEGADGFSCSSNEERGAGVDLMIGGRAQMLMLLVVFATSFVSLAILGSAIAWAIDAKAELKAWKEKHRRFTERENEAAWRANRQMIVS